VVTAENDVIIITEEKKGKKGKSKKEVEWPPFPFCHPNFISDEVFITWWRLTHNLSHPVDLYYNPHRPSDFVIQIYE
jgi:hypothetical protein